MKVSRLHIFILFMGLFVAVNLQTVPVLAQNLVAELLAQGLKLYAAKDYSGAADYLGQVVDMSPDQDQARYYLIFSLSMAGDYEKSLYHAKILARKYPGQKQYTDLVAQLEKAMASERVKKEKYKAARSIPKEVLIGGYETKDTMRKPRMSTKPRDITPPKELTELDKAVLAIDEERYASATSILEAILKKEPQNAKALHYRGVIDFNAGNYEAAKQWFEKSVKADPNGFQTRFLLGDCFRAQEDYARAAEQFSKAVEIKKDVFAQINLADCYIKLNKIADAEKILAAVVDKDPKLADAVLGLAQIKLYGGYTQEAVNMVNKILAEDPANAEAHYVKARILLDAQLYDDAVEEAKAALENFPGNLKYRSIYALALIKAYRVPQGLEEAAAIIKQYPDNLDARLTIAEGLIISGAYSDAEEHLELVEKKIKSPEVPRLRAMRALKDGEVKKAHEFYREYIQRTGGQPKPYMDYAAFLETNGDIDEAIQAYEEIAAQFKGTAFADRAKKKAEELYQKKSSDSSSGDIIRKESPGTYRKGKVKF